MHTVSAEVLRWRVIAPLMVVLLANCAHGPGEKEALERRLSKLQDQLDERSEEIDKLTARVELLNQKLRDRPEAKITKRSPETPAAKNVATATDDKAPPSVPLERLVPDDWNDGEVTVADSSQETMHLYYKGRQAMDENRLEDALKNFRDFLKLEPAHVYADRAEFNILQAHFMNKEYGLAIVSANLLETRYPQSVQIPDALYKRALSYLALGQDEPGRLTLSQLQKRFPSEPASLLARKKLAELNKASSPPLLGESLSGK